MEGALGTRRCALNTNMQPRQQKADTTKQHRSRLKWALVYTLQEIGFYSRCLKNNWKNSFPQYFHDNVLCIEISGNSHCFGCKDLYSIAKHTTSSMIFHVHPPPRFFSTPSIHLNWEIYPQVCQHHFTLSLTAGLNSHPIGRRLVIYIYFMFFFSSLIVLFIDSLSLSSTNICFIPKWGIFIRHYKLLSYSLVLAIFFPYHIHPSASHTWLLTLLATKHQKEKKAFTGNPLV